jgi:NADH-quinone oxidoreductase subunit M
VVLAAIYLLWAYQRMAHGPVLAKHANHPDLSAREYALLAPVLALILVIGLYPKPLLDRIEPTSTRIVKAVDPGGPVDARAPAALAAAEGP